MSTVLRGFRTLMEHNFVPRAPLFTNKVSKHMYTIISFKHNMFQVRAIISCRDMKQNVTVHN